MRDPSLSTIYDDVSDLREKNAALTREVEALKAERAGLLDTIRLMLILWDEECADRYVQEPTPVADLRSSVKKP